MSGTLAGKTFDMKASSISSRFGVLLREKVIFFFFSQNSGTWSRLEQHKPLFAEPKGKGDFVEVFCHLVNIPS